MTTGTKVLFGILGAAAAGVVIGLLIAPEKGSETRKRIAKTTGDWADQVGNVFKKTREQYNDLKDRARSMKSAAEQKVSNLKEDLG
jgi:gas vesicle protein